MRQSAQFPVTDLAGIKNRLLAWVDTHATGVYLDSNSYPDLQNSTWECLAAAGIADTVEATAGQAFSGLQHFYNRKQDWLFGFFGYDLKNEVEKLFSNHPDGIAFPDLLFFQPVHVAGIRRMAGQYVLEIHTLDGSAEQVLAEIEQDRTGSPDEPNDVVPPLRPRLPKSVYLQTVDAVRQHIMEGDIYELNLCQEFFAEQASIRPCRTFRRLNQIANAPFSAYLRHRQQFLLCASPERFLRKEADTVLSQPIKGTRRRHLHDPEADRLIREDLFNSTKDRAENVMIVDLVRNDLVRHCLPGSVRVTELFGIYSFQTVHQMISTVEGTLRPGTHPVLALRDAFPMGSMTGAPKVRAMELIEQYEHSRRGLFSGAVGYFSPDGDFDFNVVIRSILYNAATGYLSCPVGGAIVYDSVPELEYEECLIKANAMLQALGLNNSQITSGG